ncbi:MAG: uracil phosphoribosyltransferase [Opitutales bacterium]
MPLTLVDHPAAKDCLTQLRDEKTDSATFRRLSDILTTYVLIEATRGIPTEDTAVATPLEPAIGQRIRQPIVLVPILRAGIGMLRPAVDILPDVAVGFVGLERDEATAEARSYYCKLPPLAGKQVILLDPMLATGGSAAYAVKFIRERGGETITFACVVAAPEGLAKLETEQPDLPVFAAALDRELDASKFIRPGLGDYGDRLFGT